MTLYLIYFCSYMFVSIHFHKKRLSKENIFSYLITYAVNFVKISPFICN